MSNPTSSFGWQMPTASDLVTDLPADFETFGQAVDTTLADLKGGTSGQVLSKASNTDMDFTWVTSDDANAIQNAIVDAKGDLIAASAADTPARLAVGNNGETLLADSSTATGLKYSKNAPLGGMAVITGGTALTGATTITVSGFSVSRLTILINGASSANASSFITLRFNSDSGGNYGFTGIFNNNGTLSSSSNLSATSIPITRQGNTAGDFSNAIINVEGAFGAGMAQFNSGSYATGAFTEQYNWSGFYVASAPITSVSVISSTGNFDAGSIIIYGV